MEDALLVLIQNIQDRKKADGIAPVQVLRSELNQAVSAALNNLWKDEKINVGETLNDKWIAIA